LSKYTNIQHACSFRLNTHAGNVEITLVHKEYYYLPAQEFIIQISPHSRGCYHFVVLEQLFDLVIQCSIQTSFSIKCVGFTFSAWARTV